MRIQCVLTSLAASALFAGGMLLSGCDESAVELKPGEVDVVLPAKPLPVESFAAQELTNFLSRVLGSPVPVVEKAREGRGAVMLGRAAGFDVSGLERDAFRTKVESSAEGSPVVRIAGRDGSGDVFRSMWKAGQHTHVERATLFGVYAFLEDFAGVRFYFPGELGTVANRRGVVRVPVQDRTSAPWFTVRSTLPSRDGVWYEPLPKGWHEDAGKALSWLRQRFETERIPFGHGQNRFRIVERFAATHPEYCQLRADGTRCTSSAWKGAPGEHLHQLCQSSAVWDVFHDDIVADGRTGYVDVMPQDGYVPCACQACQSKCRRNPDGSLADSFASELVWGRTAELAQRFLDEGRTDLVFTQMSYGGYSDVPDVRLPTNIAVMVAVPGPWNVHNPGPHSAALSKIRAWDRKMGRRVWLWTYPHKYYQATLPGIPSFAPRAWGRFFKDTALDIAGAFCESETDRWLFHYLNYYVFSRIAWNPAADVDAVIDEHNRLMFGAGSKEMAKFLDILEEKWVKDIVGRSVETPIGPQSMPPCENEIWTKIYSPSVLVELERLLAEAERKTELGSLEARRIDLLRREFYAPLKKASDDYLSLMGDVESERKSRAGLPDAADALRDAKWLPCTPGARIDSDVFFSSPDSMAISTCTNKDSRSGWFAAKVTLEPSAKYRLSYFVKCDDVQPLFCGGGVSAAVRPAGADGRNVSEWTFPAHMNFLSGTTDWIPQVFTFETDASGSDRFEAVVLIQVRYASGTAHFDDVRLDRLSR